MIIEKMLSTKRIKTSTVFTSQFIRGIRYVYEEKVEWKYLEVVEANDILINEHPKEHI